jgi:hypothetical protein
MSTLYLHIGMPKTGSTSIQNFLNQNKSGLDKYNMYFYSDDKYGNFTSLPFAFSDHHSMDFIKFNNQLFNEEDVQKFKDKTLNNFKLQIHKNQNKNFIVSSEHIFTIGDDENAIRKMANFLKNQFDNVVVIIFLRNQLDYVLSSISTQIKTNYLTSRDIGITRELSKLSYPENSKDLYYDKHLLIFEKFFGNRNLRIKKFNKNHNSKILNSIFLNILEINSYDSFKFNNSSNKSLNLKTLKSMTRFNYLLKDKFPDQRTKFLNIDNYSLGELIDSLISLINKNDSKKILPSKEIYKNWRNEFLVSNNEILKKYSINLNKNHPLIFNKSYISNHEFNEQKIINVDDNIDDILIGLSYIYKEFDRLSPLILIKPKYYGFVDILSTSGLYMDMWISKRCLINFENIKPITSIKINIFNPLLVSGECVLKVDEHSSKHLVNSKNCSINLDCNLKVSNMNSLIIKTSLDSNNKIDKRDLSFVIKNIIFS